MVGPDHAVTPKTIARCERVIRPYIRRTPVLATDGTEFGLAASALTLKLELLQHSGSFKARGAFTNLLTREIPEAGIVAASGGNHGAAVAYAAMRLGKTAKIFVPSVSSPAKIARIREYGADLTVGGEGYADALAASEKWARQTGAMQVPAFDQNETIMGQGSLALELEEQAPNIDGPGCRQRQRFGGGGLCLRTASRSPASRGTFTYPDKAVGNEISNEEAGCL
jgi:threonine dehydratase